MIGITTRVPTPIYKVIPPLRREPDARLRPAKRTPRARDGQADITQPNSNEHDGVLLANDVVYGKGQNATGGWFSGYTGPTVIRLTQ